MAPPQSFRHGAPCFVLSRDLAPLYADEEISHKVLSLLLSRMLLAEPDFYAGILSKSYL